MKYFIEREDGSWLRDPDGCYEPGSSPWTRNPDEAWQFEDDKRYHIDGSLREFSSLSVQVKNSFEKEDLAPGNLKITEHEFVRMIILPDSKSDMYRDYNGDMYDINYGKLYKTVGEFHRSTTRRM